MALTLFDAVDTFPAASRAFTVNEYVVDGDRPDTVAVVPVTDVARVLPWYTSYPVTPTLSVDADHDNEDDDVPVTARFAGAEGGCVSPPDCAVALNE